MSKQNNLWVIVLIVLLACIMCSIHAKVPAADHFPPTECEHVLNLYVEASLNKYSETTNSMNGVQTETVRNFTEYIQQFKIPGLVLPTDNDCLTLRNTKTLSSLKTTLEVMIPRYCFYSIHYNVRVFDAHATALFFDLYLDHSGGNIEKNQAQLHHHPNLSSIFHSGNDESVIITNQMNTYVKENWISQLKLLSESQDEEVIIGQAKCIRLFQLVMYERDSAKFNADSDPNNRQEHKREFQANIEHLFQTQCMVSSSAQHRLQNFHDLVSNNSNTNYHKEPIHCPSMTSSDGGGDLWFPKQ